jgi:transposase
VNNFAADKISVGDNFSKSATGDGGNASNAARSCFAQAQLDLYRAHIEALFANHPDHDLFGSLPGAGPKLAPRLLSEIGSDRSLYEDAQSLQCMAGTAPVSYQSGQVHKVNMRLQINAA